MATQRHPNTAHVVNPPTPTRKLLCTSHGPTAARYAQETRLFRALRSLWVGNIRCLRLEWRTDWIDCERFLSVYTVFLTKRKKCKKVLVATIASSVVLHSLPKADAGRGSNTKPGIAKPVDPFHHSHRIVVNNLLQTFHRRLFQIW